MLNSALVSSGPYWQLVESAMSSSEATIHLAHLRCVQGAQDSVGTLFLTSHQVLWRAVDPRIPEGSEFQIAFPDLLGVEQPGRLAAFRAFRLVTEEDGRPADTYFFPHSKNEPDRLLCNQMCEQIESAWLGWREQGARRPA